MKKHPPFPTICERCDRKIDDDTGWGVLIWYAAQAQPSAKAEGPRSNSLAVCRERMPANSGCSWL